MLDATDELLELVRTARGRNDVAVVYRDHLTDPDVNWGAVNRAIMLRWSRAALIYIKEQAWRLGS